MTESYAAEVLAVIQRAEDAAYQRGKLDAKKELLVYLGEKDADIRAIPTPEAVPITVHTGPHPTERKRAPRGIVPKFVKRVLSEENGITPKDILLRAETDFEKMIQAASIRSELRAGRNAGRYTEENGQWFSIEKMAGLKDSD